jgi:hypothetical protein
VCDFHAFQPFLSSQPQAPITQQGGLDIWS